jgi:hypothetical protein
MKAMFTVVLIGAGLYFTSDFGISKAVHMSAKNSNYQQNIDGNSQ